MAAKAGWNGEFYVNFNPGSHGQRDWDEAVRFGFISAGGQPHRQKQLRGLVPHHRLWVYAPSFGYVGVGLVLGPAVPSTEARFCFGETCVPILDVLKVGKYHRDDLGNPDAEEWFAPVRWLDTVSLANAFKPPVAFYRRNIVVCSEDSQWDATLDHLKRAFPKWELRQDFPLI